MAEKESLSEDQLYRLALYKQFKQESQAKIEEYSKLVGSVVSKEQGVFAKQGIEAAQDMIGLKVSFFQKLPVNAIESFVGRSFWDGNLLDQTLFASSYPKYMEKTKELLLTGIAKGYNPRKIAREIRNNSTAPLWESLRLARTETINAFRSASLLQYKESGVVTGWEWLVSEDERTCDECMSKSGTRHSLDEAMDEHPNGRCAQLPLID